MLLCWIAVDSHQSMLVWATVYGIFANCALSQVPASNAYFGAKNPEKSGTRVGTITTINSIPLLTGPYIAGKLIDLNDGDYLYAQIFGGLCIIIGALFLVGAQWADTRKLN
jgi:MFS family permease